MSEFLYKLGFEKGFLTQNPRIIKASHDKFKYFKKKTLYDNIISKIKNQMTKWHKNHLIRLISLPYNQLLKMEVEMTR